MFSEGVHVPPPPPPPPEAATENHHDCYSWQQQPTVTVPEMEYGDREGHLAPSNFPQAPSVAAPLCSAT